MRTSTICLITFGLTFLCGCASHQPKPSQWPQGGSQTVVDLAPKKLLEVAQQAISAPPLSVPVEKVENGTIYTGWKEYPGELHIVRRWYERTRFRITVSPDFSDPNRSSIAIEDQTEERATESQPWYPAPNTRRPERGQDVLNAILARAAGAAKG
ncbi:MAG TPA: hypothetical protein VH370_08585 [Humisphaera sp.]|jgi:hypothetical protein|nr:hypothetical protein [Humisphaera sp.]